MRTPLFFTGSSSSNVSTSADRYGPVAGGGPSFVGWGTLSAGHVSLATQAPCAGTISQLRVRFPTALTQGTYTVTLMKGATKNTMSATAMSVTIGTSSTDANDLVSSIAVSAGEYLAWRVTPSGTPTAQTNSTQIACVFDATTSGRSPIFSNIASGSSTTSLALGCGAANGATEALSTVCAPVGFTITNLYASLNTNGGAPGTGNTRTLTLRKGTSAGALSDTLLTVTFGATDTVKFLDLSATPIVVAAGDFLSILCTVTGTPVATSVNVSMETVPSTSGQSVRWSHFGGGLSATVASFGVLAGRNNNAEANEANTAQLAPAAMTIKSVRVDTSTAPGASKSRTVRLRQNAADSALVAALADANATVTATTDVAVAAGDTLGVSHTPTATPAASTWTSVASIIQMSAGAVAVNFTPSNLAGETFEGIRNTSKVIAVGAYSGTPTSVQVSLWDTPTGGNMVSAWVTATTQAAGVYSHTFTGIAVGGPYYHRVRDNGGTATNSTADLYVGAIVVLWGQSQAQKLHTDDISGLAPGNGMQVRIAAYSNQNDVSTGSVSITKFDSGTTGLARRTGSGVVALANQWHADTGGAVPLLIVTTAYQGTSIEYWTSDRKGDFPTNADVTTLWGTSPTTGFAWHMAAAARYQASVVMMMQGTADVNQTANVGGSGQSYAQLMDALKAKFETLYNGTTVAPLFAVLPHQRSDDGNNTFALRAIQYAKAVSGGTWRLLAWLIDWQLDGDGSPHQATGATGNIRGGTRIGRGLAKLLFNSALDIAGPQIVTADFTDATRTAIDVTYDRNIKLASGTAFAGSAVSIPAQHNVSGDNGSSFATIAAPGITAQIVAANRVRLTKTSGAWTAGQSRVDYLRGVAFASDATTTNDFVGTEANMEANFLSKVVTDTSGFDGGRGMPAAPIMGTGLPVALPVTITATAVGGSSTTSTVRYVQA